MEPDVKAALMLIYREKRDADADAAARWIDQEPLRARRVGGELSFVGT